MSQLETIKGVGPRLKQKLNRNQIYDCFDLMMTVPRRYEIFKLTTLADAIDHQKVTLKGTVVSVPIVHFIRKNFTRLSVSISIENRVFKVSIFNREYLKKILDVGAVVVITGTLDRSNGSFTCSTLKLLKNFKNEIEPQYSVEGISNQQFQKIALLAFDMYGYLIHDDMPESLLKKYKLIPFHSLIQLSHKPFTEKDLEKINRRMKYEELFKFQFKMQYIKLKNRSRKSSVKVYQLDELKRFIQSLPFELTNDQKKATNEIVKDIKSPFVMNRLLQGDTGSGKTVVAAISMFAVLNAGYQVAMMVPTEILSRQHYKTIKTLFQNTPYKVVYLSGKLTQAQRSKAIEEIKEHPQSIIIGTHALFSKDVIYNNLGYVITDEQHRFGVNQRKQLREKGYNPDVLYMSATPIPRTLAISLFGDMEITTIKEKPKNRIPVETKLFTYREFDLVEKIIEEELTHHHQAFVVTPLITESETMDLSNAQKVYRELSNRFKEYKVGIIHSKIPQEDKEKIMYEFEQNQIQLLISTTVIEVGVDVPNATLMVVLNSERYGLSQLHQLRGRVGRSDLKSYCLLVYQGDEETKEKLEILEKTDDGFVLSEEDLRLRGPGEFFGIRQSGELKFKVASIIDDYKILEIARDDALDILLNKTTYQMEEYRYIYKYLKSATKQYKFD